MRANSAGEISRERIAEAIRMLEHETGYSPTVREIADRVGRSKSSTYNHLLKLVEAGRVTAPKRLGEGWRLR